MSDCDCDCGWAFCGDDDGPDELAELRQVVRQAAEQLRATHYPDTRIPAACVVCGTRDGAWGCRAQIIAGQMEEALP